MQNLWNLFELARMFKEKMQMIMIFTTKWVRIKSDTDQN